MKTLSFALLISLMTSHAHAVFIPEASGVCQLGEMLIVAGDEEPRALWVMEQDSKNFVKKSVQGPKWDDLEDLARVDDQHFLALTSHSRTKSGRRKPEREQLMLLQKQGDQLTTRFTWSLREQMMTVLRQRLGTDLDMRQVEESSPDQGGLNAEGMALVGGVLYIGLRSPLTHQGEAIILVARNGAGILRGEAPQISDVITTDLLGKGIRGFTAKGDGLLLLAGPSDDVSVGFQLNLFTPVTQNVRSLQLAGFSQLLRPEGLALNQSGQLTLVQDFEEIERQDTVVQLGMP